MGKEWSKERKARTRRNNLRKRIQKKYEKKTRAPCEKDACGARNCLKTRVFCSQFGQFPEFSRKNEEFVKRCIFLPKFVNFTLKIVKKVHFFCKKV